MDEIFVRVVQTETSPGPRYDITVEHTVGGVTTVKASIDGSFTIVGVVEQINRATAFITQSGFLQPSPPVPFTGAKWELLTLTPV